MPKAGNELKNNLIDTNDINKINEDERSSILREIEIKQKIIDEFTENFSSMEEKMNHLEKQKNDLSNKLYDALEQLKEYKNSNNDLLNRNWCLYLGRIK